MPRPNHTNDKNNDINKTVTNLHMMGSKIHLSRVNYQIGICQGVYDMDVSGYNADQVGHEVCMTRTEAGRSFCTQNIRVKSSKS